MIKKTLLQIVQDMLTAIDTELVSDVAETEEAQMCVNIVNRALPEMLGHRRWRHLKQLSNLAAGAYLNQMILPTGGYSLDLNAVYYNGNPVWYLTPNEFLMQSIQLVASSTIVEYNNIKSYIDRDPQFFTSFNDVALVFDAIPDISPGLVTTKFRCLVYVAPTAALSANGDYASLPPVAFPTFLNLCISKALAELKGDTDGSREIYKDYTRGMSSLNANAGVIDPGPDVRTNTPTRRGVYQIYKPRTPV